MVAPIITSDSFVDKRGRVWETISTPSCQFRMLFSQVETPTVQDRGPTLEVYGLEDGEWREVLKFDCFEKGPHWHRCYPGLPDAITNLEATGFNAAIDFAAAQLRQNFGGLISEQGFTSLASEETIGEVSAALPVVEARLREMARAEGPVQVLRSSMG